MYEYDIIAWTKGDITKFISAKRETNSLRTTVSSSIVRLMKLKEGDELQWELKSMDEGLIPETVIRSDFEKKLEGKG